MGITECNCCIAALTCARKSIALVSNVARASITPLSVVASCMRMTVMSASSTLIHICSSEVTHITMLVLRCIVLSNEYGDIIPVLYTDKQTEPNTFSHCAMIL